MAGKITKRKQSAADTQKPGVREWLRRIFFWIALCVFIGSSAMLVKYLWTYYTANKDYEDILNQVTLGPNDMTVPIAPTEASREEVLDPTTTVIIGGNGVIVDISEETAATEEPTTIHYREDIYPPDFPGVNHALLAQMNPDYLGYIVIPGTLITYPVVQGKDNSHYLRYDFNGKEILSGCPFLDCQQERDLSLFVSTICAHNQKDNRMFGTLDRYKEKDFWKENPYVYIMTPNGAYRYKVFAAYEEYYVSTIFAARFDLEEYRQDLLEKISTRKLYETDVKVTTKDHILTLYTCTADSEYRFVVHAVCENY